VSARHLSFIETGRARPSREMLLHLAERLDVPLRYPQTGGKQLAVASDLHGNAGVREEVPEKDLIRGEHRAAERSLQPFDCPRKAEAVPAEEDAFRLVSHVSRCPGVHRNRVDAEGVVRQFGRRRRDDVEALTAEVGGAEFVELRIEPGAPISATRSTSRTRKASTAEAHVAAAGTSSSAESLETKAVSSSKPIA
jgi:transcriptional regulator with XRE-family HTH domain